MAFRTYLVTLVGLVRGKLALALALMVAVSLTEGVGLLLLVPLLQLIGLDVQLGPVGRLAGAAAAVFAALGVRPTVAGVLAVYAGIISTQALLQRYQSMANAALQHELVVALRRQLYGAITRANWLFIARSRSADFAHALTTELERIGEATAYLLYLLATTIVTAVYLLLALQLSPVMTGLVMACGAGLSLLLRGKTQAARVTGEALSDATGELYAATIEHLGAMKTAKSYGTEARSANIYSRLAAGVVQAHTSLVRNGADLKCWLDIGSVLILSGILFMAIEALAVPTAGILLLLFLYARMMPKFASIQVSWQHVATMVPAFAAVLDLLARCQAAAETQTGPPSAPAPPLHLSVCLQEISFRYVEDDSKPVLDRIGLTIRAGEATAIVGPSGAGKSTVADLIMGLVAPERGQVLIDGEPLRPEQWAAWRQAIGYVAQDTFLFHDSIRANLLWARPEADALELEQALRWAAAADFVAELPEGIDTVVGDRGVRLSGGERQRLALARALLRRPSLLILDEATSALDAENERRILQAIDGLRGELTVVIITHRLSAIRGADIIHVLERGRLVESGRWETLLGRVDGHLRALWLAQQPVETDVSAPL